MKAISLLLLPLLLSACMMGPPPHHPPPHRPPPHHPGSPHLPDAHRPDSLIGLPLPAAQAAARRAGLPHRVVERDGVPLPVTRDFIPARLNFAVSRGHVVRVTRG